MISGAVGPGDHEAETSSIWLVSILGGEPRRLRGDAFRAVLSPDDSLVAYMSEDGIWLADADGENPREFIEAKDWEAVGAPEWSPDGKRVIYRRIVWTESREITTLESRGLDEAISTVLVDNENLSPALFAKDFLMLDDRLIYAMTEPAPRSRENNLWETAIDPRSGRPKGEPKRLTDWVGFNVAGLSATADGSQLALRNSIDQSDVYVGGLGDGGRSLDNVRRLTLDDRHDRPWDWKPDGRAVVFESDRYGNADLFVQDLDQRSAQDLVLGAGDQRGAHLTPDGTSYLYWGSQKEKSGSNKSLLRIPVGGGPTELVLETRGWARFDCATEPSGPCLLAVPHFPEHVVKIHRLDPVTGKGEELWSYDMDPEVDPKSTLSPDGSRIAQVGHTEEYRSIRLLEALTGEVVRDIEVEGLLGMDFIDVEWSPDGSGFYVIGESPRGVALLRVDLQGEAHVLYEDLTGNLYAARPSPDGHHLAFEMQISEANIWMIEKF